MGFQRLWVGGGEKKISAQESWQKFRENPIFFVTIGPLDQKANIQCCLGKFLGLIDGFLFNGVGFMIERRLIWIAGWFWWWICKVNQSIKFGAMVDFVWHHEKKWKISNSMTIFGRYNPKLGFKTYGFCLPRAMGYGLLRTYGLWVAIPCPPTWWNQMSMGFQGLWVRRVSTVYGLISCMPIKLWYQHLLSTISL